MIIRHVSLPDDSRWESDGDYAICWDRILGYHCDYHIASCIH